MKFKVLKKIPGFEVNDIIDSRGLSHLIITDNESYTFASAIVDGWLEEVKKESLDEKIFYRFNGSSTRQRERCITIAQIAKEHYLEVFDKAWVHSLYKGSSILCKQIRKAIEQA